MSITAESVETRRRQPQSESHVEAGTSTISAQICPNRNERYAAKSKSFANGRSFGRQISVTNRSRSAPICSSHRISSRWTRTQHPCERRNAPQQHVLSSTSVGMTSNGNSGAFCTYPVRYAQKRNEIKYIILYFNTKISKK